MPDMTNATLTEGELLPQLSEEDEAEESFKVYCRPVRVGGSLGPRVRVAAERSPVLSLMMCVQCLAAFVNMMMGPFCRWSCTMQSRSVISTMCVGIPFTKDYSHPGDTHQDITKRYTLTL
eukprot:302798-Prorocentrum_minimum.AAC.2